MNRKQITDILNRADDWMVEHPLARRLIEHGTLSLLYLLVFWLVAGNPGFFGGVLCGVLGGLTSAKINGDL